ncbi:hypothetical protein [Natroniella sp. ANB-PHB2]|uniref:hypothetical protein n=1 Tax=Natroniella sp. ANB-PHB2 TaxID=3384444 RepID=UPI0038D4C39C
MKDKVVIGSLAGALGSFMTGIITILLDYLALATIEVLFLNSILFLAEDVAHTTAGIIFGLSIHLVFGSIVGLLYTNLLPYTGKDYLFYKGFLLGAISWLVIGGIIGNILGLPIKDTLIDTTIHMGLNILFGLAVVYTASYLSKINLN